MVIENKKTNPRSDTIYYEFNRKLTWKDFQGKPAQDHFGGAVTSSGFAFDSEMNSDGGKWNLTIGIYCFFSKQNSWKKAGIHSDYHLLHEQHHFDITRLGMQKLEEELYRAHFTEDNYDALLNAIFNKVYNENVALQEQYDRETRNSIDVKKQLEWNDKIASQIRTLQSNNTLTGRMK